MTAMLKQFQATPPPAQVKAVEEIYVTCGGADPYYQCLAASGNTFLKFKDNIHGYVSAAAVNYNQGSGSLPSNTVANPKGELKAITTRSGLITDGPTIPTPLRSITLEVDERIDKTYMDPDLTEYTIKVPPPPKMLKALLSNKEKLQELANTPLNENCSAVILKKLPKKLRDLGKFLIPCGFSELKCKVLADLVLILKKLPEKLRDPGKFLIPCGFSELKCKALADLGASINLMPLLVWKKLGLPELISTRMTLKLVNRAICTPTGIARDVFVSVGKFTFPADFFIIDYESDHRVPLILGRPFLRIVRALIDVHGEEMILRDDDVFDPEGGNVLTEKLLDLDYTKDLHPPHHINQLSGSTTSSSPTHLLEEFANELALITFPSRNNDLSLDIDNLADDNLVEFTDEHALDYSSPSLYDEYDNDLFKVESDTEYDYNDPFDSKGEKIKESKLLIDELDLPSDFLPPFEYDSFLFEDFSKVDALSSTNNEDKVFNLGILIQENLFEVITRVAPEKNEKKLVVSHASLILEDFDPPIYELLCFKEVL
nr:hypothetical protein [Tanacetum cinerariifolium]